MNTQSEEIKSVFEYRLWDLLKSSGSDISAPVTVNTECVVSIWVY